jgi:multicomponent Na+:H+ antiporter subunit F
VTIWTAAILALMPPFTLAVMLAWRGSPSQRFAAYQFAGTVTVLILTLMAFATDQASITDLALTLVLLSLPGTMLLAVFLERWI